MKSKDKASNQAKGRAGIQLGSGRAGPEASAARLYPSGRLISDSPGS